MYSAKTFSSLALSAILVAGAIAVSGTAMADEVYSCTNQNTALHFVVYENGNTPRGGHMYVAGIQVAVLKPRRINDSSIRATVAGNTANTEFVLNKGRKQVFVEIGDTSKTVCDARVLEN